MVKDFSRRHVLIGGAAMAATDLFFRGCDAVPAYAEASGQISNPLASYPYTRIDYSNPNWPKTEEWIRNTQLNKVQAERLADQIFNYYFLDNPDFLSHLQAKYGIKTDGNFVKDAKEVMWGTKWYMHLTGKKGFYKIVSDELSDPPAWNKALGISGFRAGDVHYETLKHTAAYPWEFRLRVESARLHGIQPTGIYTREKYEFSSKIFGGPDNTSQPDRWGGPTPPGLLKLLDPHNEDQIRDASHRCPIPNFFELFTDLQPPKSPIKITNMLALNAGNLAAVQYKSLPGTPQQTSALALR